MLATRRLLAGLLLLAGAAQAAAAPREVATAANASHGQPEFVFTVDEDQGVPDVDVAWFTNMLEGQVAEGERFADGETMQVGGMVLKLRAEPDGRLRLLEPDMQSMPIELVDSVTATLHLLRVQRDTAQSIRRGLAPDFANIAAPLLITEAALTATGVRMQRTNMAPPLTGWTVSAADEDWEKATFRPMSVYEAMLKQPLISQWLAVPGGFVIETAPQADFRITQGFREVPLVEGSFLDTLRKYRAEQLGQ